MVASLSLCFCVFFKQIIAKLKKGESVNEDDDQKKDERGEKEETGTWKHTALKLY